MGSPPDPTWGAPRLSKSTKKRKNFVVQKFSGAGRACRYVSAAQVGAARGRVESSNSRIKSNLTLDSNAFIIYCAQRRLGLGR